MVGHDTALLIHDYETPVWVQGYNEDVGERSNCRIVHAVVAYDHPTSGDIYMLVIHQAILIPDMVNNLLCPMQLRDHGLAVNDEPKYMALNPMEEHHAITFRDRNTQGGEPLRIPLELDRVTSYFLSRKPTKEEYKNRPEGLRVELTAEAPDWDPASKRFQQQEDAMLQADSQLKDPIESWSLVEFWGLPPLILFFNMSTGWFGRFVLSTECYRTRKLGNNNLNWPRCSAWFTESLALTDGGFCQKQTLYISDYVKFVSL